MTLSSKTQRLLTWDYLLPLTVPVIVIVTFLAGMFRKNRA